MPDLGRNAGIVGGSGSRWTQAITAGYAVHMESYGSGVRRRLRSMFMGFTQVLPPFVALAYLSSLEKALLGSVIGWSIWVAVSERKDGWTASGFWWIVATVGAMNAIALWALPITGHFKAGLPVAYPVGMAEGYGLYWLLGWWMRRSAVS